MVTLELAVFDPASLPDAQASSVPRIELCDDYASGGITPSQPFFHEARSVYSGLIFVMIRPRSGNFVYTDSEFALMMKQVEEFRTAGVDGYVTGMVTDGDKAIDEKRLKILVKACSPLPVTFHRAFDRVQDWRESLEVLIGAGCSRVLTSGGTSNAMEGMERLQEMLDYAKGRIIILPGGGVRSSNAQILIDKLGCTELHSAAIATGAVHAIADAVELKALMSVCGKA